MGAADSVNVLVEQLLVLAEPLGNKQQQIHRTIVVANLAFAGACGRRLEEATRGGHFLFLFWGLTGEKARAQNKRGGGGGGSKAEIWEIPFNQSHGEAKIKRYLDKISQ